MSTLQQDSVSLALLASAAKLKVSAKAFVEDDDVDTDDLGALEAYFERDRDARNALAKEVKLVAKACEHDVIYHVTKTHTECGVCGVKMVRSTRKDGEEWIAKKES